VIKSLKNKKVGLALGGGAALGAAHIGVLRALEEYGISISHIAGTSIGAFIAALYAFNMNWKDIEEIAMDMNWLDISRLSLSQYGLLSNDKLGDLIKKHIGDVDFDQADIHLAMIATDITTGEKVVLSDGDVATAVMASTCVPGVFIPVEINDRLLVDGGIVENVPVTTLKEMGADTIVGVDLNAMLSKRKPRNIIEVLLKTFDFTLMTATKLQTADADILIEPDLSSFNMIDSDQVADLIEQGYADAKNVLKILS